MQRIYQVAVGTKQDVLKTEPCLGERMLEFKRKTNASVVTLQAMLRSEPDYHYVMTTAFRGYYEDYVSKRRYLTDPVFQRCLSTKMPFEWSSVQGIEQTDKGLLLENHRWLTMPLYHEKLVACLHVAGDGSDEMWRERVADFIWHGMNAGDEIVQRLVSIRPQPARLSATQLDCLSLLAAGKDIEDIVGITRRDHRTVHRHISEAMLRLNARTQSHAIVKAISLGILPPAN